MKYNKILLGLLIPCAAVTLLSADESWTTGAYANNANISKTLTIPDAKELIVNISGETEKNYDFIIIKDSNGDRLKKLSGKINESFIVSGSLITANLKSDYSITKSGVTVSIKAKTEVAKSKSWTTGAYKNDQHIEKKLSIPNAEELEVTIVGETEENYDFITIKNSENKKIKKLSGKMNKHFKVKGNSITAILDSDYSITKSGVTVTIKAEKLIDSSYKYNSGKTLTRDELKELILNYCQNPTEENKRAIEKANTSKITDMSSMFNSRYCGEDGVGFDGDLSGWDTSSVTNMKFMFLQSEVSILPESFNTSKVTNMEGMFASSKIKILPDNFDTSNVVNMEGMFSVYNYYTDQWTAEDYNDGYGGGEVTEDDIPPKSTYADTCQIEYIPEGFDTSKVTNMKWMFYKNRKITSLPNSFNTSNAATMVSMFQDSIISQIPWFNTSNVKTMIDMFRDTQGFNQDISDWDVTKMNAIYTYDGAFIPWEGFNQDSSLEDRNIPEKFRED